MRFIRNASFLMFAALFFAWAGCSSVTVKSDYDPEFDFASYKTFAIWNGQIPNDELAQHPLVQKRIKATIARVLQEKGYKLVDSVDDADFGVVTHAGSKEKIQVTDWGRTGWYDPWWGPYGGRVDVSQYNEGTLVIDLVDVGTKTLAWRGMGTKVLDNSTGEKQQRNIDEIVAKILAQFPPKG